MGSVGELILEGHFRRLKDDVNKMANAEAGQEVAAVLHQTFQYLEKLKQRDMLDSEGTKLFNQLAGILERSASHPGVPEKMPMEKARRKVGKVNKRNTA